MDHAVGVCVQCKVITTYSKHWVKVGHRITEFEPGIDRPLCGPQCADQYYKRGTKKG